MNKYYQCSDEYKSLHNIFFNGAHYTIIEVLNFKSISDKDKLDLIKNNLKE